VTDAAMHRSLPQVSVSNLLDAEDLSSAIRSVVEQGAAAFLPTRRWFGDKSRHILRVDVLDAAMVPAATEHFAVTIATISFADGSKASYFLPLVVTLEALSEETTLGLIDNGKDTWRVVEALSVPRFHGWLLDQLAAPALVPSKHGEFTFEPTTVLQRYLAAARTGESKVVPGEQSNTSIIYGNAAILKAFRKLQPGINPDIEIGAFLTERTDFQHVPPLLGYVNYHRHGEEPASIAVLQTFVPSVGDAWTMTLRALTPLAESGRSDDERDAPFREAVNWAALLGSRTGQLHVALASEHDDPAFAPQPVVEADIASWQQELNEAGQQRRADLEQHPLVQSDPGMASLVEQQLSGTRLQDVARGFEDLLGTMKIRVHGDYHLGQVLQTVAGDAVILDFEGEPSRPIAERRLKTSSLKDVAGMLRSFSYARVATERASDESTFSDGPRSLAQWEDQARAAFLESYRAEATKASVTLIPESFDAFLRASRAWEADKAIYEIHYELNNRPDWLGQVLRTLSIA
jgi:maltose alpha-D-glucosyltransferase/alpha-amylase